ncbi:neuropeptides B/W receptor type 2 [Zalophus californianus]|uniref:Neuropeptides B/W receptor type 2 n=1 Tax=Zalophus californianus TaxID=9704 RepID=A0A6J2FIB6_ZALCA|nr:neuropeptides B/W receptor type 2 [Zalophus californianus]
MQAAGLDPLESRGSPFQAAMGTNHTWDNGTRHNITLREPLPALYVFLPAVYSVICAVGLTGNTAVIYVILRVPKMKTVTNVFILNLAIANGLFTLVLPVNITEHLLQRWPFGELLCKLVLAIDHYNIFSSIYFLATMSVDRYLVVLATTQSRHVPRRTLRGAKITSLCVWIGVTIMVLPFFAFAGVYSNELQVTSCGLSFPQPERAWFKASRIYMLVLGFVVPMCTLCVLYVDLLRRLWALQLHSRAKALGKAKRKVTTLVLAVLAVGLLCWMPFHLASIVALTTDLPQTPLVISISYVITSLSYTSSCLNPFFYAFLDESFRNSFRSTFQCPGA